MKMTVNTIFVSTNRIVTCKTVWIIIANYIKRMDMNIRSVVAEAIMAPFAKIYPFLINPAIRTLASLCVNGNITIVNPLPGEKDIWGTMCFMAISARQNISGVILIWPLALGHGRVVIAGISKAMLRRCPVDLYEVSPDSITEYCIARVVAVRTKSNIIGQVGAVFCCGTIWLVS